ncbi:hypothetical protein INR49_006905 [Caranx melampygus]|nr:hypothetical protein INR49_006905 [Caranx melampygus]
MEDFVSTEAEDGGHNFVRHLEMNISGLSDPRLQQNLQLPPLPGDLLPEARRLLLVPGYSPLHHRQDLLRGRGEFLGDDPSQYLGFGHGVQAADTAAPLHPVKHAVVFFTRLIDAQQLLTLERSEWFQVLVQPRKLSDGKHSTESAEPKLTTNVCDSRCAGGATGEKSPLT